MRCIICKNNKFIQVWNDKLRDSQNSFTKNKEIILKCKKCDLVFLKNLKKDLENSFIAREKFNKNNSIKEFYNFHQKREINKFKRIISLIDPKNKSILESNCGAGVILNHLKNKCKETAGLDDINYKNHVISNGHLFFSNLDEIKTKKFDIIFSLSELEHKYDPISFLKKLKKILKNKGIIVLRIPNYNNIYMLLLGFYFKKFDFRTSHNFYFSEKNLDMLFHKCKFKIVQKVGHNEYSFNHTLTYLKNKKRIKSNEVHSYFEKNINDYVRKNIEDNLVSTSLIYILKNIN